MGAPHVVMAPPWKMQLMAPSMALLHGQSSAQALSSALHFDFTQPRQTPTLLAPSAMAASGGEIVEMLAS